MFTEKTSVVDYATIIARWNDLSNTQCMMPITAVEEFETELAKVCTDYEAAGGSCDQQISGGINAVIQKMEMLRTRAHDALKSDQE